MSSEDGTVVQYNTMEMKEEAKFSLEGNMAQCATNNAETLLYVASRAGELKIFDL